MTRRLVATGWTIILIVGTLLPKGVISKSGMFGIPHFDKVSHLFAYALLVFLWSIALNEKTAKLKLQEYHFMLQLPLECY